MAASGKPPNAGLATIGTTLARLLRQLRPAPPLVVGSRPFATADGALERFDLTLAAPAGHEREVVRSLARTVVLVAESPRRNDDRYHLVARAVAASEATLVPLGSSLQVLGDRAALELARTANGRRTALWLCLPTTRALGEVVDPDSFDPETEAAIDALLAGGAIRWAVAATLARNRRQIAARMILWLDPNPGRAVVEAAAGRLRTLLASNARGG